MAAKKGMKKGLARTTGSKKGGVRRHGRKEGHLDTESGSYGHIGAEIKNKLGDAADMIQDARTARSRRDAWTYFIEAKKELAVAKYLIDRVPKSSGVHTQAAKVHGYLERNAGGVFAALMR